MNTCDLRVSGVDVASDRRAIRWELFVHRDVRDVLRTPRADTLRVVHRGRATPDAWAATLREAGYPALTPLPELGPAVDAGRGAAV